MTESNHHTYSPVEASPIGCRLLKLDGESLFTKDAYSPVASILEKSWAVLLFDDMGSLGDDGLGRLLEESSPQRRAKAQSYLFQSDSLQSLVAYHLLKNALQAFTGIGGDVDISIPVKGGKPVIKGRTGISFNFSHCKDAVACAIDTKGKIGADVESLSNYSEDLVPAVLSGDERRRVLDSANPDREFIRLWTLKESLAKARGKGLDEIGTLPTLLNGAEGASFFSLDAAKYVLSVCRIGG